MLIAGAHLSAKRLSPNATYFAPPLLRWQCCGCGLLYFSYKVISGRSSEDPATHAGEGPLEFSPRCLAMLTAL
jgi:hypothetical protein